MSIVDEVRSLETQLKQAKEDLASANLIIKQLRGFQAAHQSDIARQEENYRAQINRSSKDADHARRELADVKGEVKALTAQLHALRVTTDSENKKALKQADDLRLANKRLTDEQNSLRALAGNADSSRRAASAIEKVKSEVADANAKVQSLTRDLTIEKTNHERDNVRAREDVSSLNEQNRRLTEQQNALRAEVANIRVERDRLRKSMASPAISDRAADDIKDLRAKVESLTSEKRTAEKRADTSDSRLSALRATVDAAKRRVTDLEESLKNSARLLSESRNEVTAMREQVARAKGEADYARRAADALAGPDDLSINKHIATIKVQSEGAQRRVTELEASVLRISGQLDDARDESSKLRQQLAKAVGETDSLRKKVTEKDMEIQGLTIKLDVARRERA